MNQYEQNSVQLKLQDYLELYEFRKNLEEKGLVCRKYNYYGANNQVTFIFIKEDEAVKEILDSNKELAEKNDKLVQEHQELNYKHSSLVEENKKLKSGLSLKEKELAIKVTLDDVKTFSIFEFWRWKRSQNKK
jgi:FtsZ-binding cell division protein ZapB